MPILSPIDDSLVVYIPGTPAFSQLVSDTLGDLGTAADGFDAALDALFAILPDGDAALNDIDASLADLWTATEALSALSIDDIALDWSLGAPALSAFGGVAQLRSLPPIASPPAGPPPPVSPPSQPPVICLPLPQPSPSPEPCAQGFTRNAAGDCVPIDATQPPTPPPPIPPIVPPIVPPTPEPCPQGFVRDASGNCIEQPGVDPAALVELGTVLGKIISSGEIQGTQASALVSGGLATALGAASIIFSTVIPVIGAFLAFNSIFGSWQAAFAYWATAELQWAETNPLAAMIRQLQDQVTQWQADQRLVGSYEYGVIQHLIDRDQAVLSQLYTVQGAQLTPDQQAAFIVWAQTKVPR